MPVCCTKRSGEMKPRSSKARFSVTHAGADDFRVVPGGVINGKALAFLSRLILWKQGRQEHLER